MKKSLHEKQLEALKKTARMLQREYDKGKVSHLWHASTCPLCKEFGITTCKDCPFGQFDEEVGCVDFVNKEYGYKNSGCHMITPIDETLSIVNQVIDYWKE